MPARSLVRHDGDIPGLAPLLWLPLQSVNQFPVVVASDDSVEDCPDDDDLAEHVERPQEYEDAPRHAVGRAGIGVRKNPIEHSDQNSHRQRRGHCPWKQPAKRFRRIEPEPVEQDE